MVPRMTFTRSRKFPRLPAANIGLAALFVVCTAVVVGGEDRPRELPKDGSWVRWQCEYRLQEGKPIDFVVTLSLVGSAVEDDQPCRWLEVKQEFRIEGEVAARVGVEKILVPEEKLLNDERPLDYVRRLVIRRRDGTIQSIEGKDIPDRVSLASWQEFLLWAPGMRKGTSVEADQSKDVKYQQGSLARSEARSGSRTYRHDAFPESGKVEGKNEIKYTIWQHPELPLGFAEAHIAGRRFLRGSNVGDWVKEYRLQDFGMDAKTELAESN